MPVVVPVVPVVVVVVVVVAGVPLQLPAPQLDAPVEPVVCPAPLHDALPVPPVVDVDVSVVEPV